MSLPEPFLLRLWYNYRCFDWLLLHRLLIRCLTSNIQTDKPKLVNVLVLSAIDPYQGSLLSVEPLLEVFLDLRRFDLLVTRLNL